MRVFIHVEATLDRAYWSWLSVLVEDHLVGGIHHIDQTNWADLDGSEWLSEEGDLFTRRRLDELTKLEMGAATGAGDDLDAPPARSRRAELCIEIRRETPAGGVHNNVLGPIDAYKCLAAPLTIFVEDADSDGEFWVTIWTAGARARLTRAFEARRIEFSHCGGKTKMPARFTRWSRRRAPGPLRALILKDSDKLWATHAPPDPTTVLEAVLPAGTHRHTLRKREIENYLPSRALALRETCDPQNPGEIARSERKRSRRLALEALDADARSFYDMKEGFKTHSPITKKGETAHHALFAKVSAEDLEQLKLGIAEKNEQKISDLFETARELITREALEEVCDFEEFEVIMDAIEALL